MIYSTRASSSETVRRIGRAEAVTILQKSSDKAGGVKLLEQVVQDKRERIIEQWLIYFNSDRRDERY